MPQGTSTEITSSYIQQVYGQNGDNYPPLAATLIESQVTEGLPKKKIFTLPRLISGFLLLSSIAGIITSERFMDNSRKLGSLECADRDESGCTTMHCDNSPSTELQDFSRTVNASIASLLGACNLTCSDSDSLNLGLNYQAYTYNPSFLTTCTFSDSKIALFFSSILVCFMSICTLSFFASRTSYHEDSNCRFSLWGRNRENRNAESDESTQEVVIGTEITQV